MWRGGGSVGIGRAWRFRLDLARVQGEGESYTCMRSLPMYHLILCGHVLHSQLIKAHTIRTDGARKDCNWPNII